MAEKNDDKSKSGPLGLPPLKGGKPAAPTPAPLPDMPSLGTPKPVGGAPLPEMPSFGAPKPTPGGLPSSLPAAKSPTGGTPSAMPMWSSAPGDKLAGMPMFRGAASRPNSLLGRLMLLKTKDLAFIGAGLGVLVMAPLAEYLVSEGQDQSHTLKPMFDEKGVPFPSDNPAELGVGQIARGDVPGMNPDVITPLNARNPSDLIMGPNGEEKPAPPPASVTPPKPEAPRDSVWDKVVDSAKAGATTATRKVGLPKPNVKLAGALEGLRGLSGGSSGAHLALAAPDSKGLFSGPRNDSHMAPTSAAPGYRGAARSLAPGTGGPISGRGGGNGAGGGVANDVVAGGPGGGGQGTGQNPWRGDGETTKNPSGSSTKDNKALGESLEYLRRKMEMQKAIDLKWAKKQYDELERKKMIEQTLLQTAQQAFLKVLDKLLEGKKGGGGSGGGGGGDPKGGAQPKGGPGNTAPLPGAGSADRLKPPQTGDVTGQSGTAVGSHGLAEQAVGNLGTHSTHLSTNVKPTLTALVGGINQQDQYGAQIYPPANSALGKAGQAADAHASANDQLKVATANLKDANTKTGEVNTQSATNLQALKAATDAGKADVQALGTTGTVPKNMSGQTPTVVAANTQVQAIQKQTEKLQATDPLQRSAENNVRSANDLIRGAPRAVDSEIAQVQQVLTANPNCAGCSAAITALQNTGASLAAAGRAGDTAIQKAGNAVERSGIATRAAESADNRIFQAKPAYDTMASAESGMPKKFSDMTEVWNRYNAAPDQPPTTPDPNVHPKSDTTYWAGQADPIRTAATSLVTAPERRQRYLNQLLQEAQQQLGSSGS